LIFFDIKKLHILIASRFCFLAKKLSKKQTFSAKAAPNCENNLRQYFFFFKIQ